MPSKLPRVLLSAACCVGLNPHLVQSAQLPPWQVNRFATSNPDSCSATGYGVNGTLEIYLDKARPEALVVVAMLNDREKREVPISPGVLTLAFAGAPMTVSGWTRRFENLSDDFTADIAPADVSKLLHGLTAGEGTLTMSLAGRSMTSQVVLQGSSAAVEGMEQCIRTKAFPVAPAPFKGTSAVPTADVKGCVRDGEPVTLTGTLVKKRARTPDGDTDVPDLRLASPICVYRFGALQPFQSVVNVVLLEAPVGTDFNPPSQAYGKPMQVTGQLRDAASKYDVEPNVLTLTPSRR